MLFKKKGASLAISRCAKGVARDTKVKESKRECDRDTSKDIFDALVFQTAEVRELAR